ncbi:hypothetical protein NPIL_208511 [Nephila pilipes]|uniref:Uncharacterized protein n=1 Tax=Nephila pilipes TaxID=299642 RepID=A0A8X6Q5G4_NEPPI|nr:hypothetical protein NPIL_208511 [Nephila pilipes]
MKIIATRAEAPSEKIALRFCLMKVNVAVDCITFELRNRPYMKKTKIEMEDDKSFHRPSSAGKVKLKNRSELIAVLK